MPARFIASRSAVMPLPKCSHRAETNTPRAGPNRADVENPRERVISSLRCATEHEQSVRRASVIGTMTLGLVFSQERWFVSASVHGLKLDRLDVRHHWPQRRIDDDTTIRITTMSSTASPLLHCCWRATVIAWVHDD
jgi:hypothetical protein